MKYEYACPCCGEKTYPVPAKEAVAYICYNCNWENDVFVKSEEEPSDENHGISLKQARENYQTFGTSAPNHRPPEMMAKSRKDMDSFMQILGKELKKMQRKQ